MEGPEDPCRATIGMPRDAWRLALPLALLLFVAACGGGGAPDPGFSPSEGELGAKPEGGFFISDPHYGGHATRVHLLELGWGRLVDVYDVDQDGARSPFPVLRDVVIGENWITGG